MPRPRKPRCVQFTPAVRYFKPAGVPLRTLEEVGLSVDELEALRLKDVEGFVQEECARQMQLSQSTFQRILAGARAKVAMALVSGKAIRIEKADGTTETAGADATTETAGADGNADADGESGCRHGRRGRGLRGGT